MMPRVATNKTIAKTVLFPTVEAKEVPHPCDHRGASEVAF